MLSAYRYWSVPKYLCLNKLCLILISVSRMSVVYFCALYRELKKHKAYLDWLHTDMSRRVWRCLCKMKRIKKEECLATIFLWCLPSYLLAYIPTYLSTYLATYLPTYLHTCMHIYLPTVLHTCMHIYLHTVLHTYLPTYLATCLPSILPACLATWLPTYLATCLRTYPSPCLPAWLPVSLCTWLRVCLSGTHLQLKVKKKAS